MKPAGILERSKYHKEMLWMGAALPFLYIISRYNYNLFHSLADGISIVIAVSVFMIVWNARRILDNHYLLYVGISFLFFALLDLLHMLGNKNMGVFPGYGNLGPALYIASRYLISISLLIAPLFIKRKINSALVFAVYTLATVFILMSIFYWQIFPACFVEGVGLTAFKVISDYVICLILLGAIFFLLANKASFDSRVFRLIVSSIILSIATGVAFTLYADPFGITNAVGHFFQIASFYLLYKAIIETSLVSPYDLLFRDLKKSEEAFRASERRYRELVQNANSAIIRWKADGTIAFFNEYAQSFFGYGAEEIIGRHVSVLTPEFESTGADLRILAQDIVNHPERYVQSINENLRRDGRRVWMAWTNKPVFDDQGRVSEILAVGADITERKRAEAALQTGKERLELLAGVAERLLRAEAPQVIVEEICRMVMAHLDCQFFFNYLVEEPGQRLRLNGSAGIPEEAAAEIRSLDFGMAVCGCVARDGQRIIANDIQRSEDPRTQLVKSYGVQAYCCHPLMAQGRLIGTLSFGTRTRLLFTPDEVALMKSVADQVAVAMQRLQSEQAVRESEEQYRLLFSANPNPMFVFDEETLRFLAVNDAAVSHYGWSREEFLGMTVLDVRPAEDRESAMESIRRHRSPHEESIGVFRHCRKDGTVMYVEITASSISFAGRPGRLSSMNDVTERKKAEEALQDHARKLEETNRELEAFAYTISHDLRAPLRAINGFANMLAEEYGHSLEAEGKRRLGVIEANAVKMGTLIDDLLAFSRAGRTAMNISQINMNRIVSEVVETLKGSEAGARAAVHVAALPPAQGDPALVRQVLANLLENAVKFSRNNPAPRIEVGSFERDGEGVYFVKDNGVGFDMKYKEKLFGVFQRLVTEKEFEGTGVGLAIVQRLVARHGGRIWAEGRPGEGATFFFTLKRQRI